MPEIDGDPVHVRRNDLNPLNQLSEQTFKLKKLASGLGIDTLSP
ncbi:hypothetical protein [Nocardia sp. XZ_19_369]|nr:hypothetical protein [Nocardia sp. XZ_19_369]